MTCEVLTIYLVKFESNASENKLYSLNNDLVQLKELKDINIINLIVYVNNYPYILSLL
jgi:hypothetical protein